LLFEGRCVSMDWPAFQRFDGAVREVHGLAKHVENAAKRLWTNGDRYRCTRVDDLHAARHSVRWLHRDRAHAVFTEMLFDLGDDVDLLGAAFAVGDDTHRGVNRRKPPGKFDVDHRPDDLDHPAASRCRCCLCHSIAGSDKGPGLHYVAAAPETTSM